MRPRDWGDDSRQDRSVGWDWWCPRCHRGVVEGEADTEQDPRDPRCPVCTGPLDETPDADEEFDDEGCPPELEF